MKPNLQLLVVQDADELAEAATSLFEHCAEDALKTRGEFSVVLSGGSTPRKAYQKIAERLGKIIPWNHVHFFWTDERNVPPDHPDSNFKMVWDNLLNLVPVPRDNVHRIRTEIGDPEKAAAEYNDELRKFGPHFDLTFLGLGRDGHTASLFPDGEPDPFLIKRGQLAVSSWVKGLRQFRISMTPEAIDRSRRIAFLIQGSEKARILKDVIEPVSAVPRYPAQLIRNEQGRTLWIVDHAAAVFLEPLAA